MTLFDRQVSNLRSLDCSPKWQFAWSNKTIPQRVCVLAWNHFHERETEVNSLTISYIDIDSHFHSYYQRIAEAKDPSKRIMSCIMDGMAQAHCSIPWEANYHSFGKPLKQHLQGVLEHHRIFVSYISLRPLPLVVIPSPSALRSSADCLSSHSSPRITPCE